MSEFIKSAVSRKGTQRKRPKPHPDFPLFHHHGGRWAKKVRGKLCYFGKIAGDPKGAAALEKWLEQKDDLLAGRKPRPKGDGLTIKELCERFLTTKKRKREAGELSNRSFDDYKRATDRIMKVFGPNRLVEDLRPEDFGRLRQEIAKSGGLVWLGNEINRSRIVFRYAEENGLIDKRIVFGEEFRRPKKSVVRRHQQQKEQVNGKRLKQRNFARWLTRLPFTCER